MILDLVIIGGGASGFMGAITAINSGIKSVVILESTSKVLEKVRISGGGRCNVTNSCWDNSDLVENYPRGEKQLLGLFNKFSTKHAFDWFQDRGLKLKIEEDGRVFPISDSSYDVIKCLSDEAQKNGVKVYTNSHVKDIKKSKIGFNIYTKGNNYFKSKNILLCTGGHPSGRRIAQRFGHTIIKTVPALFSFRINDKLLEKCSGISLKADIKLIINKKVYSANGPILITHQGFSGPAILRLSSFSARTLYSNNYIAELRVNWLCLNENEVRNEINLFKLENGKRLILKNKPFRILPKRLWQLILLELKIDNQSRWADLSKSKRESIVKYLTRQSYSIKSRGPFGEEFVTAGGVSLNEIDFKTMESKLCKGLFFAGEILDIDGITGGFNFQHCWTSGWVAGKSLAIKSVNG